MKEIGCVADNQSHTQNDNEFISGIILDYKTKKMETENQESKNNLYSKYISNYYKKRMKIELNYFYKESQNLPNDISFIEFSSSVKKFLNDEESVFTDLNAEQIHEIMRNLYRNHRILKCHHKDLKKRDKNLYTEFKKFIFSINSDGTQEYIKHYASETDKMRYIINLAEQSSATYKNYGVTDAYFVQVYLEEIFIRLFQIDPKKALAMYQITEDLRKTSAFRYNTLLVDLAKMNYNVKKWRLKHQKERLQDLIKEQKHEIPSTISSVNNLDCNIAITNFQDNIYDFYNMELSRNQKNIDEPNSRKKAN